MQMSTVAQCKPAMVVPVTVTSNHVCRLINPPTSNPAPAPTPLSRFHLTTAARRGGLHGICYVSLYTLWRIFSFPRHFILEVTSDTSRPYPSKLTLLSHASQQTSPSLHLALSASSSSLLSASNVSNTPGAPLILRLNLISRRRNTISYYPSQPLSENPLIYLEPGPGQEPRIIGTRACSS
ncbi:hypothetical protein F5888DRAFT_1294060 [Russula emetica]|nr:hypothetical protein F5888DRAFT_1294060 [Russula emetica]